MALRAALEDAGLPVTESDVTFLPSNVVPVSDQGEVDAVMRLIDLLDDHEDVQDIHSNIDIPDELFADS